METPELLAPEARARLESARILLHETEGFLYLPILAPTEVAAAAALACLLADGHGTAPFHIAWPVLPDATDTAASPPDAWEAARKQLLENLDHAIAVQAKGAILVLDASPSDRHHLALESVTYLNQRREALRRHQLRLILLWPAAQAQALMGGAPDLWSMRALAPVIEATEVHAASVERSRELTAPAAGTAIALSPSQQDAWRRWLAERNLVRARLSVADALALLDALYEAREWQAVTELSEGVLRTMRQMNDPLALSQRADALSWLSLSRASQGNRQGALAPAMDAVDIYEKLAAENFAAYAPALASSLNNLSVDLANSGDREGSLKAIRRAVEIREKLAADNFAAHAPDLASSLNNLAARLKETGDRTGALATLDRAIETMTPFAVAGTRYAEWLATMRRSREGFDQTAGP